jgi:hypothetical protein
VSPARTSTLVTVLETENARLRVSAGSTEPTVPTSVETAPRSTATVAAAFGFSEAPAITVQAPTPAISPSASAAAAPIRSTRR